MPPSFTTLAGWHDAFHEILNHLEPIDNYEEDDEGEAYFAATSSFRSTLLSLALSSNALSIPSLDKLWRSLNGISPLLQLLPNYQRRGSTYHITGEILPEAWLGWLTYATRVRDLFVLQNTDIDPSVWSAIWARSQGAPILPNLGTLSMLIWNPTDAVPSIRALAAPSLRSVSLSFQGGIGTNQAPTPVATAAAGLMLQELSVKSPRLNQLFVHHHITLDRDHLMCLSRFTEMEALDIVYRSTFDVGLILMLANLKNLTRLKASILLQDSTDAPQLDLKDGFQKVTTLELRGSTPHLVRFMLASSIPELKHLRLGVISHLDCIHTSLASICRHIGPQTLTCFRVELCGPQSGPPRLLMTLLDPLLPFVNLEELEFFFEEHTPLRDEDLGRFARAWPKLRVLVLSQFEARRWIPDTVVGWTVERPTLHGLIELARECPRLDRLCIPDLAARTLPQVDSVPLLGHGLLYLCIQNLVGAQDEERQLDVAVILDRLFPRLKLKSGIHELPHYEVDDNPRAPDSENIARLLRAMQIARTHYPGGV